MKNKNFILWIFNIVLSIGFSYGVVLSFNLYHQLVVNLKTREVLKKEVTTLNNYLLSLKEKQKSLLELNKIITQIRLKKLTPEDWFVYHINEEARTSADELKTLLETVSKGRPYNSNFWFKPEEFAFLKESGKKTNNNQNNTSSLNYHFKLKGKFLFPK